MDDFEMTEERKNDIKRLAATETLEALAKWAWDILSTSYDEAPVMVVEDPSVMDVLAAYILKLENT